MNNTWSIIKDYSSLEFSILKPITLLHNFNLISHTIDNYEITTTSKSSNSILPPPLYSSHGNSLNPKFIETISSSINVLSLIFIIYQSLQLGFNTKKLYKKNLPTSWIQISKYFILILQLVLQTVLYYYTSNPIVFTSIITIIGASYLSIYEYRTSTISCASLLTFWLTSFLYSFVILIQDSFSKHKIIAINSTTYGIEITTTVLNFILFVLESDYYKPGFKTDDEEENKRIDILSYFTFSFIQPVINKIYITDDIKISELPNVIEDIKCDSHLPALKKYWNYELGLKNHFFSKIWSFITRSKYENKPVLFSAMFKVYYKYLIGDLIFSFTNIVLMFSQPFVFKQFIIFFNDFTYNVKENRPPIIIGYALAILMFLISVADFIVNNQAAILQNKSAMSMRSSLTVLIYEKALKFSPASKKKKPTGDIINSISVDIGQINGFFLSLGTYASSPIQLIVCLIFLFNFFGYASFLGLGAALISAPLIAMVQATVVTSFKQMMKDKDERTSLITEILSSARNIKLYSWENPMLERLSHIRNDRELQNLKKIGVIIALAQFLWSCLPFIISVACFAGFSWLYNIPLTPEIVFPALSLVGLLMEPMAVIPSFIVSLLQVKVSLGRLADLLTLEEIDPNQNGKIKREDYPKGEISVEIKNANFVWNLNESETTYKDEEDQVEDNNETQNNIALKNINFIAKRGKLTCLVGKVGSGKSTLLNAILGDIPIKSEGGYTDDDTVKTPSVETFGSIAYCPQSPWILNGTVKENILFGYKYDSEFYRKTIIACELASDFKTLADGDKTIVGEKGISLSGGQKARISLARAVYSRADIYLLDDVLSAVDAHVGKALIKQVLSDDGIIGNRTKILATNAIPVLHKASDIYLLSKGSIIEHGDYDSAIKNNGEIAKLVKEHGRSNEDLKTNDDETNKHLVELENAIAEGNVTALEEEINHHQQLRRASVVSFDHIYEDLDGIDGNDKPITSLEEEKKEKGVVPLKTIVRYIKECNLVYFSLFLLTILGSKLLNVAETYVLKDWTAINKDHNATVDPTFYLGLYSAAGAAAGFLTYIGYFILWSFCIIKAAAYFHSAMAEAVLHSPMSFFDTTPVGRVLNRFTQDISTIDFGLPFTLISFFRLVMTAIITFAVLIITVPPIVIIILLLSIVYNYYRVRYVPASRELKRLQSIAGSPVLSIIQESLNGVDTIKAFHKKDRFIHKCKKFIDERTLVNMVNVDIGRWLSMRLETISAIILISTATFSVWTLGGQNPISPSTLGFLMTYAMNISFILSSLIKQISSVQSDGVALERIIEYCDLPSEAPMIIKDKRPTPEWPENGIIKFKDYSTKYRENLPPVLEGVGFTINSKEKVGIVGRTGAGKSSLTLALFRVIEATGGDIEIDGINIGEIGLRDLRSNLNVIPQETHTFRASVRENLDPLGQYNDDKLWKVLELAHLKEHVESMETEPTEDEKTKSKNPDDIPKKRGLDAKIEDGGSNLSAGQKQLLCLARALLNEKTKILVSDEASSNIDPETDKIIQQTIRSEFNDKTILTIAHRIDTIMDSDKILVLDHGKVAEFDTPQNLLKNKNSIFYSLSKEGGYI
ncbi:uncharacterized protein KGF55_004468 [Candida pseudojiufengensis]|uniref:uncharacterized protein n=1 Tax=Candida pseudojiufengensis TaxID=497109 RepID=UPI0022251998|nr:uncharacterized protein KGF55_004468 [Candida pseudojiufengensis]KAI5960575.1 hypothetical protein KGF55_004468 [Candida pseudojiufengensis]